MTRLDPARRARRSRRTAALALTPLLLGCGGEITGVAGGASGLVVGTGSGTGVGARLDPALLGRWQRGAFGGALGRAAEVTWSFAGDGSALRTVVTRELGLAESASASALWRVEGGLLVVVFPQTGAALRVPYRVEFTGFGDALYLDGERYARVGG